MTGDSRSAGTATCCAAETGASADDSGAVETEPLLELLGDEYACELLCALEEGPRTAHELVEQCGMSRSTVYRRLDRMTDAGIVGSRQGETAAGRQRTEYHLLLEAVAFTVAPDGVTGTAISDATDR